ncbi:TPA: SsrA-binding protein SmpB [Candidatus Berkelbacteria bacterium]|uniref:SsrA-binding protein n=1 Tax=Berkelbacteria bacterium GW2011_GWE1_39_12 TaxID=1618337 RepID=A0A0G4B576_9BACT|nr:MAG: ssrA RNA (tmRNA)-binding protein, SsrA-binding protein [Berkelbacteria bacterium GW2011_GWE1_39_12]HBO60343.1 SsrA-binding protein SmpB [Candidatus Berkelbacteria bacterium]
MSIAYNKKANLEYEILEKFEAGIVLSGLEIKMIRAGKINLNGTYCRVLNGEIFVLNMHLGGVDEPERSRKLLMHKSEIQYLASKTEQKGLSIVALAVYIKKGKAKLEIGLARGKKIYDHREQLKKKDIQRQKQRELVD